MPGSMVDTSGPPRFLKAFVCGRAKVPITGDRSPRPRRCRSRMPGRSGHRGSVEALPRALAHVRVGAYRTRGNP